MIGESPPLLIIPADALDRSMDFVTVLQIPQGAATPTFVFMYIGIKLRSAEHFVAFFRCLRSPWYLFDGLQDPVVAEYKQPKCSADFGKITFLVSSGNVGTYLAMYLQIQTIARMAAKTFQIDDALPVHNKSVVFAVHSLTTFS